MQNLEIKRDKKEGEERGCRKKEIEKFKEKKEALIMIYF